MDFLVLYAHLGFVGLLDVHYWQYVFVCAFGDELHYLFEVFVSFISCYEGNLAFHYEFAILVSEYLNLTKIIIRELLNKNEGFVIIVLM